MGKNNQMTMTQETEVLKSLEVFFSIGEDKIKSIISLHSDGLISISQEDGHEIYVYPSEVKAIIDITK